MAIFDLEQVMLPGQGPFGLGFGGSIQVCQRAREKQKAILGSVSSKETRTSTLHIANTCSGNE